MKPLSDDSYRYVREIENEFVGQSAGDILLDIGTWIYFKKDIVMKDRGLTFGDRGYAGIGDFSGFIGRLRKKQYAKIMVHNFHSRELIYDHWMYPRSTGIKQAMLENYDEIRKIKAFKEANTMNTRIIFSVKSVFSSPSGTESGGLEK